MGPSRLRPSWLAVLGAAALSVLLASLAGCSGYTLFAMADSEAPMGWQEYVTPRPPESEVEKAVVEAAQTEKSSRAQGYDVYFIITDSTHQQQPVQCVSVVARSLTSNPYATRAVTHYRVVNGMISARSHTATEFFVDADFERAIMRAAAKSMSADPVLIYWRGTTMLALSGHPINRCNADVKVYMGDSMTSPLASKRVSGCFTR